MTRTASYTSATNAPKRTLRHGTLPFGAALLLITLAGLWLRGLRIAWQPLWWDEGYSVFFATEPLRAMLALTAADIHPPLYYALLHGWIAGFGSAQPAVLRYASVLTGVLTLPVFALLAYTLFPRRPAVTAVALLLLAFNPMHIFYSQEVRMYILALLLGMAATICIMRLSAALATGQRWAWWCVGYVCIAALLLHTLYYAGFLLLAHALWAGWRALRRGRGLGILALTYFAVVLLCLPWWLYAAPKLLDYVKSKVQSDQDVALMPWDYLYRHLVAFGGGHIASSNGTLDILRLCVPALLVIALWLAWRGAKEGIDAAAGAPDPYRALAVFTLVPALLAYIANLRFPFFPEAGERLLLFILPYLLLLIAAALAPRPGHHPARRLLLLGLLLVAYLGVTTFYTTPRYTAHDYRPIVAGVTQQGTDADSVLALFPWQVGFWRAYTPQDAAGQLYSPQPSPVGQTALEWTPAMQEQITADLARGVLWFPEPRSLGSNLPLQGHAYLRATATNVVEHWYSAATLLSAWVDMPAPVVAPVAATWGDVALTAAGVAPTTVASANQPILIRLAWQFGPDAPQQHVSLSLRDGAGRVWAVRDYEPIGKYAQGDDPGVGQGGDGQVTDQVGLLIPVGLPPGSYQVVVGVGALVETDETDDTAAAAPGLGNTVTLATIEITSPAVPLPAVRMPVEQRFPKPSAQGPAALLGYSGLEPGRGHLAGTEVAVRLAFQATAAAQVGYELVLTLVDGGGATVASYRGWPLPDYPVTAWPPGALVTVPAAVQTPADLPAGTYALYTGLAPVGGDAAAAVKLTELQIVRRPTLNAAGAPQFVLDPPVQFGSHAQLLGYDLARDGNRLHLALYWNVLQPLLPQHHIFVHLDRADGATLAQADGPPQTATGAAPTGTWLPGEQLTTDVWLDIPPTLDDAALDQAVVRVGLYEPVSETRLPATRTGEPAGDSVDLRLVP